MQLERQTTENPDGTITVATRATYESPAERAKVAELAAFLRDLAGMSKVGDQEVFDTTAMVMMTEPRKRAFCDVADLLEKVLYGD